MEIIDHFLEEKMFIDILGYSMTNRPKGLLYLTLKFLTYIVKIVKSNDVLAMRGNHEALFQLLQFIYNSLKNDMLIMNKEEKLVLINFLSELTNKITYDSPHIAEMLLAD